MVVIRVETNNRTRKMLEETINRTKSMLFRKIRKIDKYLSRLTENKREAQPKWRMRRYFWFYSNGIIRGIDVNTLNN